jgi:hypothetical protein
MMSLHVVSLSQPLVLSYCEVTPFVAAGHVWEVEAKGCHSFALLDESLPRTDIECVSILLPKRLVCRLFFTDILLYMRTVKCLCS